MQFHQVLPIPLIGTTEPQCTYSGCVCNEYDGLVNRHLADVPIPQRGVPERAFGELKKFWSMSKGAVRGYTPAEVLAKKIGSRRAKYVRAFDSLAERPLEDKDCRVFAFVKIEKNPISKLEVKHPRLIQYRSPRFTASLAQELLPIEELLFTGSERCYFAKHMNQHDRAERLLAMERKVKDPIFVGLDANNFDAHETWRWTKAEHDFYRFLRGSYDPRLEYLLKQQMKYRGRTRGGIRYTSRGRRCSGDYNTGLGNSVVMLAIVSHIARSMGMTKEQWDALVDGDDSVFCFPRSYLTRFLQKIKPDRIAKLYGMSIRVEFQTTDVRQVEFCQCKLIRTGLGTRMVRKPYRVLQRLGYCCDDYSGAWNRWCTSVGQCELACHTGVPVLQALALAYMRIGGDVKIISRITDVAHFRGAISGPVPTPITPEARFDFEVAFGITLAEQLLLEHRFDNLQWKLGKGGQVDLMSTLNHHQEMMT